MEGRKRHPSKDTSRKVGQGRGLEGRRVVPGIRGEQLRLGRSLDGGWGLGGTNVVWRMCQVLRQSQLKATLDGWLIAAMAPGRRVDNLVFC